MDIGTVRPTAVTPPVQARPAERAGPAVESVVPERQAVAPANEPQDIGAQDSRSEASAESAVDKLYRLNPATGLYVWRAVDESTGEVMTQIPTDSFLLQKAAYRRANEGPGAGIAVDTSA